MNQSETHLLHKIVAEKVKLFVDNQLSVDILTEDILATIDTQTIEDEVIFQFKKINTAKNTNFNLNYGNLSENLSSNSSLVKLKALQDLQNALVIDTKQNYWLNLSYSLQKCFVCTNAEVYHRALRIHHKIIAFSNTFLDGYLNLLKSTILLLHSRYYADLARLVPALKLILECQMASNRFLFHAQRKLIDEIVFLFVKIINFKTIIEIIGALDGKMRWMAEICCAGYVRKKFFDNLREIGVLTKNLAKLFVESYDQPKTGGEPKMFTLYFFYYLLIYKGADPSFFPIKLADSDFISQTYLIEKIVIKNDNAPNDEIELLLKNLFANNSKLINLKLLNLFLAILSQNPDCDYILEILTGYLAENSLILYEIYQKSRRTKNRLPKYLVNIPQKIVDLTTDALEAKKDAIFLNLQCCRATLENHSIALLQIHAKRLIFALYTFYENNLLKLSAETKIEILLLFHYFYVNFSFDCTTILFDSNIGILHDLIATFPLQFSVNALCTLSNDKIGRNFLNKNSKIFNCYLEELWGDSTKMAQFLFLLFCLQFNEKTIIAILAESDDDEQTLTPDESGNKTILFSELIERTLQQNAVDFIEQRAGLLSMKVMWKNLNLLAYFQVNHQAHEKFPQLAQAQNFNENSNFIHQIVEDIENIGLVNNSPPHEIFIKDEFSNLIEFGAQNRDFGWLQQARRIFKQSPSQFKSQYFVRLLEIAPKIHVYHKNGLNWPQPDSVYHQLYPEDIASVKIVINFGMKNSYLKNDESAHDENLKLLIKQTRIFLDCQPKEFSTFDYFIAVIFLLNGGDLELTKNVLSNVSRTNLAKLVWTTCSYQIDNDNFIQKFYQHFQIILQGSLQTINALQMLTLNPTLMIQSWLGQCFFNILPFDEIVKFFTFSILFPIEYQLYYFFAIFQHLQHKLCILTHDLSIDNIFKCADLSDFKLDNYLNLIEKLSLDYRNLPKL